MTAPVLDPVPPIHAVPGATVTVIATGPPDPDNAVFKGTLTRSDGSGASTDVEVVIEVTDPQTYGLDMPGCQVTQDPNDPTYFSVKVP